METYFPTPGIPLIRQNVIFAGVFKTTTHRQTLGCTLDSQSLQSEDFLPVRKPRKPRLTPRRLIIFVEAPTDLLFRGARLVHRVRVRDHALRTQRMKPARHPEPPISLRLARQVGW